MGSRSCPSGPETGSRGISVRWRPIGSAEPTPSKLHPARWRLLARVNSAALLAPARFFVGVKRFVKRRQILYQMLHLHLDAVHERSALEAIPFESVELARPRRLDHQPDRAFLRPLRRVPDVRRQEEDLSLANGNVVEVAVVDDLEQHVALELIEEFLHRIVVIVRAFVRPADD